MSLKISKETLESRNWKQPEKFILINCQCGVTLKCIFPEQAPTDEFKSTIDEDTVNVKVRCHNAICPKCFRIYSSELEFSKFGG